MGELDRHNPVRDRLEKISIRLEQHRRQWDAMQLTPEETERRLQERARVLARRPDRQEQQDTLAFLAFSLAGDRYALDLRLVRGVIRYEQPTVVPWSPAFLLGIIQHRGRVLPVLDLRAFSGQSLSDPAARRNIIVAKADPATVGIVADSEVEVLHYAPSEISAVEHPGTDGLQRYIEGILHGSRAILDLQGLMRDPKFIFNGR